MSDFYDDEVLEKAENEVEKKKEKEKKKGKLPLILSGGAIAIIFAVVIYWILLSAETTVMSKYEKKQVFTLNKSISRGTKVDDPSIFSMKEIDAKIVPDNAITDLNSIKDMYAMCTLTKNTVLTKDMFYTVAKSENGTREISFALSGLSGSVNGTIRAADYIDLYILTPYIVNKEFPGAVEENSISASPTYKKLYVSAAYTEEGVKIQNDDTTSIASRFTIVVPEKDADFIIGAFVTDNTTFMATKWTESAVTNDINNIVSTTTDTKDTTTEEK